MEKVKTIAMLHCIIVLYSLSGIFSKLAGKEKIFSIRFILCYLLVILALAIYALLWQQIIKKINLTMAFANKAVTVFWGILWGTLFFGEKIKITQIIGAILVIVGVVLFSFADGDEVVRK